ncbi:transglycosylase [Rhodoblastus sphagnicola]|uniref:Transglycosylase n=1 Tax=Rhodoblastus sphagnicola TaxID=333368 RepID=A0A2S6NAV9_9HYPH|nr:transglycosylase SLT domain-containing protein [Rhodoblastus sphagnicola]MBB4198988.1 soluble lytic murein transglycosylase-like protein [Rhodoblastus sphagnicola]PPQ31746.1 transglycosylase [Rhodoblastus sphagnicola]
MARCHSAQTGVLATALWLAVFGAQSRAAEAAVDARVASVEAAPAPEGGKVSGGGRGDGGAPTAEGRLAYRALIEKEALRQGIGPEIAEAVMAVESGYNPREIGGVGEIGLMQIRPETARMLGFVGSAADLAIPETNIHFGVAYLGQAWRLAGGDLCGALMKYRAGHGETRFSYLSVHYCLAVRSQLAARGFRVTGRVPVATFGEPVGAGRRLVAGRGCGRYCIGGAGAAGSGVAPVNFAALNASLGALVIQARPSR